MVKTRTGTKSYHPTKQEILDACSAGNIEDIRELMDVCKTTREKIMLVNLCLVNACKIGNIKSAELCITNGATMVNKALVESCDNGWVECAQLCIDYGAYNLNHAMECACYRGNYNTANICAKNGANRCTVCNNRRHVFVKSKFIIGFPELQKEW
jgi:hypothetical protein